MLAIRRSDVDDLNGRARATSKPPALVHGPRLEVDERTYQAGDQIICLWNNYRLGVRNGDRGTVERRRPRPTHHAHPHRPTRHSHPAPPTTSTPATSPTATPPPSTKPKAPPSTAASSSAPTTSTAKPATSPSAAAAPPTPSTPSAGERLDIDLTHAPQLSVSEPVDRIHDALAREAIKHLAIEAADAHPNAAVNRAGDRPN